MITVYNSANGKLIRGGPEVADASALWLDLLAPTPEEEQAVETLLGIDVPTREEMQEIEVSSRLSREGDVFYMTTPVLTNSTGFNPENVAVTFILVRGLLVTVRYATPQAIAGFVGRLERMQPPPASAGELTLGLLEAMVDRMADVLERIALELDGISHRIFHQATPARPRRRTNSRDLEATLRTIGRGGDLQSKARDTILGLRRIVAFLPTAADTLGVRDAGTRIKTIGRDVQSLSEYADFLNNKIAFLLNATLGMISIQQNNIIKLFSVVAVLFLPPTLVASIYGMNFHFMPELDKAWGYPFALLAMLAAALLPYWIFKRKGWL
ncbi:magnesium transporter CorA family protein [Magnetospirillum sp. UT-4]|uniref:magnesium transporter CorA family protein n=1 Tax=Magnetospirillum sp. UT-4 TaxID=2681467 RepID=UPI00138490DC|nr:magnesium transporter CorA family protein [Magnetospirillum sp. UT-4]CAA7617705.1 Mg2+ and Co2+ transporter [Magnetospirillum sp. UT-4]